MLTLAFEKLHYEQIVLSADKRFFVGEKTGKRFTPLGFNYDHDEHYRLLEDYWHDEWEKVQKDFAAMRNMGATVIRIHLQLGKFLLAPDLANERELQQLDRLIQLAKLHGLYLDLVGLGCYHAWDIPDWYQNMNTQDRWRVQAFFWETIAQRYVGEPAIFCFDLMNEPVVPGKKREAGAWLGADFAGKTYIQFITLDGTLEPREKTAGDWLQFLIAAVRRHDLKRLVSVGLVDWSLPRSSIKSGFFPAKIAEHVDFICAHLYPEQGKPEDMLKTLQGFCVGKPILIDETFHMKCSVDDQLYFLQGAAKKAQGYLSFYTDFLSDDLDDGRNKKLRESAIIFEQTASLFMKR